MNPNVVELTLSVVITSYNYQDYVAAAIDSALAIDWPAVEVIVVDDGSTDASRTVIESYGERVSAIFQSNGGQTAAYNSGFSRSTGDVILFLDSDDLVRPSVMRELAAVWRPSISKVQFQMETIDAQGRPLGSLMPHYGCAPSPAQVRQWVRASSAYPTPCGSGNFYSRQFLARIFPLDSSLIDEVADSYCLAAAPFMGDVVTIARPLVAYRIHGRNVSVLSAVDVSRLCREVVRTRRRFAYAQRIARGEGIDMPDGTLNRSLSYLAYRVATLRLAGDRHPVSPDGRAAVLLDAVRAALTSQGMSLRSRLMLLTWSVLVLASPVKQAERLVLWRFVPARRPRLVRSVLGRLRVA